MDFSDRYKIRSLPGRQFLTELRKNMPGKSVQFVRPLFGKIGRCRFVVSFESCRRTGASPSLALAFVIPKRRI
jgi:hypothetical protein